MKKILALLIALAMGTSALCACATTPNDNNDDEGSHVEQPGDNQGGQSGDNQGEQSGNKEPEKHWVDDLSASVKSSLSADGYVKDKIIDFTQYENTAAYRKVATSDEFVQALADAKCHYVNTWDAATETYTQTPAEGYNEDSMWGSVRVIEITQDLDLGYYKLSAEAKKKTEIVADFCARNANQIEAFTMSDMFTESGIAQIKVENTSKLLVYSKNGAKITHAGFKLTSDDNVVFRNLQFDEMWQWEDAASASTGAVGDYDAFGWAYFKISFSGYIWIDHCSFGKSYDGQIDYSNPVYNANAGTAFRAPLGADGNNGLHISWCTFNSGSDDKNGYLYKMMQNMEDEYQEGKQNYLYYNALRKGGISFNDILYGIAIPQKKGFLCGDNAKPGDDDYEFNKKLQISFANCKFTNLEDRIPKLRGGNAVMFNCVVDASQYYTYRTSLRSKGADSMVKDVNSSWKCALVSQGIVCGSGGSILAQNCIFKGIDTLLKNNDSSSYGAGGYQLINCSYQKSDNGSLLQGSTTDTTNPFASLNPGSVLNTEAFAWHTENGEQPFEIINKSLIKLMIELEAEKYGYGTKELDSKFILKSNYTA